MVIHTLFLPIVASRQYANKIIVRDAGVGRGGAVRGGMENVYCVVTFYGWLLLDCRWHITHSHISLRGLQLNSVKKYPEEPRKTRDDF